VTPDYTQLHLGFAGGGMALIDGTSSLPPGDGYFALSLIGSAGAAYADDHCDMQLLFAGGHPAALHTGPGDAELLGLWQAFVTAIEQGRDPPVTAADALAALRVAGAAAESIATGQAVRMDGEKYVTSAG
jgi:myo-inositol 2-dehydrogenase/D-chiro-inositol 1-dehydrogenase